MSSIKMRTAKRVIYLKVMIWFITYKNSKWIELLAVSPIKTLKALN